MDREELLKKKVTELREMAEQQGVVGVGKAKEELQALLAEKLGIDLHDHAAAGIGRAKLKTRIRELKTRRDEALASGDKNAFHHVRGQLKHSRRNLRKIIASSVRAAKHPGAAS